MTVAIRAEKPAEAEAVRALTAAAFAEAPHADGGEPMIIDRLRDAGALSLSLVAVDTDAGETVVGHVAFSPVTVDGEGCGWFGLGPLSVAPPRQGAGIGRRLVEAGLARLRERRAGGCVVLGEPAFYGRFGFVATPTLTLPGVPAEYFQILPLNGPAPHGAVAYHRAFDAA